LPIVADSFIVLHLPFLLRCRYEEFFASICGLLPLQNGKTNGKISHLSSSIATAAL